MSETLEVIKNRRSYKDYLPTPVPEEILDAIAEAGTYAATGRNLQSPIIVVITNKAVIKMFSKMNAKIMGKTEDFDPFYGAPALMVVLADKDNPTHVYDGSLVMGNMMLAAEDQGVGSCWIHRAKEVFETEEAQNILHAAGIFGNFEGIGNLVVGYPKEPITEAPDRKKDYIRYID